MDYPSLDHTDYVANSLDGRFTLALTGTIQEQEYQARVLAMARVYDALGVDTDQPFIEVARAKARWSVLSFRGMDPADPMAATAGGTGRRRGSPPRCTGSRCSCTGRCGGIRPTSPACTSPSAGGSSCSWTRCTS